jgi:hypothetical protein
MKQNLSSAWVENFLPVPAHPCCPEFAIPDLVSPPGFTIRNNRNGASMPGQIPGRILVSEKILVR